MKLIHEPHEERVIQERADLEVKIEKLSYFIYDDFLEPSHRKYSERFSKVHPEERIRMQKQLEAMTQYRDILAARIDAFPMPAGLMRAEPTSGTVELDNIGADKANW